MGIRITPKIHPSFSRWPSHPNILPIVLSSTSFSPQDFWSPFVPSSNYTAHPPHFHLHLISLLPFLHLLYERRRKIISNSSIQDDGSATLVFHFLVYSLSQASVEPLPPSPFTTPITGRLLLVSSSSPSRHRTRTLISGPKDTFPSPLDTHHRFTSILCQPPNTAHSDFVASTDDMVTTDELPSEEGGELRWVDRDGPSLLRMFAPRNRNSLLDIIFRNSSSFRLISFHPSFVSTRQKNPPMYFLPPITHHQIDVQRV